MNRCAGFTFLCEVASVNGITNGSVSRVYAQIELQKNGRPLSARFYLRLRLRSQAPTDHVHQVTAVA
jgi:hypothetical protein